MSEDNYQIALDKLNNRYSNPEVVKHALFQRILSFKSEAGPKFSKTLSAITAFSNTLDELKSTHKLPSGELLCNELLREICFYNLPSEVKIGLIEETGNNYPPIADILSKIDKVIIKLNIKGSNSSSNSNSQSNVSKPCSNEVSTFNVSHSKSNESNSVIEMPKCLFCGRTNHRFWECKQVKTKDERLAILKKDFPNNCISCGFRHNKQHCNPRSKCKDYSCTDANGKHNRLTFPIYVQLNATSVQQLNVVDNGH